MWGTVAIHLRSYKYRKRNGSKLNDVLNFLLMCAVSFRIVRQATVDKRNSNIMLAVQAYGTSQKP
jgi:hypothetical protein